MTSDRTVPVHAAGMARDHFVHFYRDDDALGEVVASFLADGFQRGEPVLVIAHPDRRVTICEHLAARGVPVREACAQGRLQLLDAQVVLPVFMVDGQPDRAKFMAWAAQLTENIGGAAAGKPLRVYGEMVDVLWRSGQADAALRLEDLWNELQQTVALTVLCGYSSGHAYRLGTPPFLRICGVHSQALPPAEEHPLSLPTRNLNEVQAETLAVEVAQRKEVERSLRTALRELRNKEEERVRLEAVREASADRSERLMRVTSAIADAVTREQVFEAVVDRVADAVGASTAGLWLLREDGAHADLVRCRGYREAARASLESWPLDRTGSLPAFDALRSGKPLWFASSGQLLEHYPHLAELVNGVPSYRVACLPVTVHGETVGVVAFTFDESKPPGREDRPFLQLVTRYCAQAIERLRVLEREQKSRAQAQLWAQRMELLSQTSRVLSDLDADLTVLFQSVCESVASEYAAGCAVALMDEGGRALYVVAACHQTSSAQARVPEVPACVASGNADPAAWPNSVSVPLRTRGALAGQLIVARRADQPLTRDDQRFCEELAERASVALENRRLYRDNLLARARAETLYDMAGAFIRAERVEDVYEAALDAIRRALGTERAAILAYDGDSVMRFRASRGLSPRYRQAVEGHSPWTRDVRSPQPMLVPDVYEDASLAVYRALFESEQIRSLLFIPLVAGGALTGKFVVYYSERRISSAAELEIATAIANHTATALARFSSFEELQRTVRFNELFTGILGHDLRNPLGAIVTGAHLALNRSEGEKLQKPLKRILTSSARMARMIDQLLDVTRVRLGNGIPIEPSGMDLGFVLRQVVEELDDAHPTCPLRLAGCTHEVKGYWDADRLSQVFSNLIANALQHGIAEQGVSVRVDEQEDGVEVRVWNAGVIPETLLGSLFEPMAGRQQRQEKSRGLGLGLYISREIVRSHGGTVEVSSSAADGTTFTVMLPRSTVTRREASE